MSTSQLLLQVVISLPGALCYAVGLVLALAGLRRCPRAKWLAVTGCATVLSSQALTGLVLPLLFRGSTSGLLEGESSTLIAAMFNLLDVAGLGLVLAAAFADRTRAARER